MSAAPSRDRSIVLVGMMGAGKTTIGRRLAEQLGLPFHDADVEIERAAGGSITDMFARQGEPAFRELEKNVIDGLLAGRPIVLATGGGAVMDARTRATIRGKATSIWLRCPLALLVRRVSGRQHRPLLLGGEPHDTLATLMRHREPFYAEADIIMDCGDDAIEETAARTIAAVSAARPPRRVPVTLERSRYEVLIGDGLLARAGALLAPLLPQKRAVIVTDEVVAALHLPALRDALAEAGIEAGTIAVPSGERSKSIAQFERVTASLLEQKVERRTTVIALGGGVIGDLAGFAAAATLRGLPFVQVPTTLLAQVDSSVGGKTGINTPFGKNLLGAFHQPLAVLADVATLASLPERELRAGYAEIVKAGLIGDAALFAWCEAHAGEVIGGVRDVQAAAVEHACRFKAAVVAGDEREEIDDGRVLLNLGHSFAHALEAEMGYDGSLLHGEAVAVGLDLAFALSVRLGFCPQADRLRLRAHLERHGLEGRIDRLGRLSAATLIGHMQRDKKLRDGRLAFVLVRGIGQAFVSRDVEPACVNELLRDEGCIA